MLYSFIRAAVSMSSGVNFHFLSRFVIDPDIHTLVWSYMHTQLCLRVRMWMWLYGHPDLWFWRVCHFSFLEYLQLIIVITQSSCVSILVSDFNNRWRTATHPALWGGGLLDRPPSWQACRCQSHLLGPRHWCRTLRHHGERRGGQSLSGVLLFTSKFWSPPNNCPLYEK